MDVRYFIEQNSSDVILFCEIICNLTRIIRTKKSSCKKNTHKKVTDAPFKKELMHI